MTQSRLDVATPEMLTEPQSHRQVEDDIDVSARLAAWSYERRAKLNQFVGGLIEAEPDI
jgi:hypothetical protein